MAFLPAGSGTGLLRAAGAFVAASLILTGCGGGGKASSTTTTVPPATTTTIPPPGVTSTPPNGPIGTNFLLVAAALKPGDTVTFEITFPSGRTFTGKPHTAGQDGTASAKYIATAGNPPGVYKVKVTGPAGSLAEGTFTLDGATPGATVPGGTAKPKTTTTAKRTTTTKKATTTAKPTTTT